MQRGTVGIGRGTLLAWIGTRVAAAVASASGISGMMLAVAERACRSAHRLRRSSHLHRRGLWLGQRLQLTVSHPCPCSRAAFSTSKRPTGLPSCWSWYSTRLRGQAARAGQGRFPHPGAPARHKRRRARCGWPWDGPRLPSTRARQRRAAWACFICVGDLPGYCATAGKTATISIRASPHPSRKNDGAARVGRPASAVAVIHKRVEPAMTRSTSLDNNRTIVEPGRPLAPHQILKLASRGHSPWNSTRKSRLYPANGRGQDCKALRFCRQAGYPLLLP